MLLGTKEVGLGPARPHGVRWEPSSPTERSTAGPPLFLADFALVQSLISATAELLFSFVNCVSVYFNSFVCCAYYVAYWVTGH